MGRLEAEPCAAGPAGGEVFVTRRHGLNSFVEIIESGPRLGNRDCDCKNFRGIEFESESAAAAGPD